MTNSKKYYIRAKIRANYSGIRRDDLSSSKRTYNEVRDLLNTEIIELQRIDQYDRRFHIVADRYIHFENLYGVQAKNNTESYRNNLTDVYINEIRINEHGKDGIYSFGKLEGIVTATIVKPIFETVLPEVLKTETNAETHLLPFTNNTSGTLTKINTQTGKPIKKLDNTDNIVKKRYLNFANILGWIFGIAFIGLILFALRSILLPVLAFALFLIVLSWIFGSFRHIVSFIFIGLFLFALFSWMYSTVESSSASARKAELRDDQTETTQIKKEEDPIKPQDSILVVHHRIWKDYDGNVYKGDLKINQADYFDSKRMHSMMSDAQMNNETVFWKNVYSSMNQYDEDRLIHVYGLFDSIGKANNLNQAEFANMVVSCIQDIPYALITNMDCDEHKLENPQDIPIIEQSSCFGPVKFGVQTPNEFLYTLKGDCDSRTVLCYTILKHYNYDVAILNSNQYRHSILGVNMPASGVYKVSRGNKYYLWETTAKSCVPGFLAPDYGNLDYWDFVLASK